MDLSYSEDIDSTCAGCGGDAAGWTFASDGRRVYVCAECAATLGRYETDGAPEAHPRAQFCRACNRLTHAATLNHQKRCPDCQGGAGDRAEQEAAQAAGEVPPEVAAAQADAEGAVDWDEEDERGAS